MLPTRPRLAARSMRSSCTTPEPVTATRVSCGVTLIRMSSVTQAPKPLKQLSHLVERQAHDAGVAAAELDDEARCTTLDRVRARLVVGLAGGDVLLDFVRGERLEADLRSRERALQMLSALQCHPGQHLVRLAGERGKHFRGLLAVRRLAQDVARDRDGRIRGEDGSM